MTLKPADPLLTQPKQFNSKTSNLSPPGKCGRLHLRPGETSLGLDQTVRELAIHWSLRQGPSTVALTLRHYAALLTPPCENEDPSLFRQVLLEMIAEQQEQNDSPNREE